MFNETLEQPTTNEKSLKDATEDRQKPASNQRIQVKVIDESVCNITEFDPVVSFYEEEAELKPTNGIK